MSRRALDFYPTPEWATRLLMSRAPISGRVLECCAGKGDISNALATSDDIAVVENDIDTRCATDYHLDATDPAAWAAMGAFDWVVSNPPFSLAPKIVPLALKHARVGMAMLLRLSYVEPCDNRDAWLAEHDERSRLLVLPRISFTGDGKTDNVTAMWLVVSDAVPHGWEIVRKLNALR